MKENNYLTHGIHPYHAKFIPFIPKEFLLKYSKEYDFVLDPFCGSGTTLLESMTLNRSCYGVDMNPIAYMISSAKVFRADVNKLDEYFAKICSFVENSKAIRKRIFPDKDIWFTLKTSECIDKIFNAIDSINDKNYQNIFHVLVSSIIKTVCNKRSTWNNGYIADNVLPNKEYDGDCFKTFKTKYKQLRKAYEDLSLIPVNNGVKTKAYLSNILDFKSDIKFDIVITSPPYPFAVDFVKYNRLTYYWFGWDVDGKSEEETGSRTKRNRKNAIVDFFNEMEKLYKHIFSLVKSGGYFCMTVADTQRNNENVSFIKWLYEIFENNGWICVSDETREIMAQSMAQKRIPVEHKLVFKKTGKNE